MGIVCLVNAIRCGRVHRSSTAPFFLVMALLTLVYALGILPLGRNSWNAIGLTILIGAIVACYLPEVIFG
jgi:hypothetical protein